MMNENGGGFAPYLREDALFLNMKDAGTPCYLTEDHRVGTLHVVGADAKRVSFESGDPSVALVAADGVVTAVAGGSAKITVTARSASGEKREMTAWAYVRDETATKTERSAYAPANWPFDCGEAINGAGVVYKSTDFTVPRAVPELEALGLRVRDEGGSAGVQLVRAIDPARTADFYLNAFAAGRTLHVSVPVGASVENVRADGTKGPVRWAATGDALVELEAFSAVETATAPEQRIEVTWAGVTYAIHTKPENMPDITSFRNEAGRMEAGVYTFTLDHYLLRVSTDQLVVYYRDMHCVCDHFGAELFVKNFRAQDVAGDGERYYTYFVELDPAKRNVNGGFLLGMFVVMDRDYREVDYITLLPNGAKRHGEGYVDQHEFLLLGARHWIALGVVQERVANIPASVPTLEGGGTGYVQAGIVQEVKDGEVVAEYNVTDHPVFYETSMEGFDFVSSTDKGVEVKSPVGRQGFSIPDGFRDYAHINSICIDPMDGNLIVSMRHQYSVYKIDRMTGRIIWTLGGLGDDFGLTEEEKPIAQHSAFLESRQAAGSPAPTLLMLDNHTNYQVNETRIAEFQFDSREDAVVARRYWACAPLDRLSAAIGVKEVFDPIARRSVMPMHWSTHCGSVERRETGSLVIGWGLHGVYLGVTDVPIIPLLTEYDPEEEAVEFELYATRNRHYSSRESNISYRVYKNAF